eukprot:gene21783-28802_t
MDRTSSCTSERTVDYMPADGDSRTKNNTVNTREARVDKQQFVKSASGESQALLKLLQFGAARLLALLPTLEQQRIMEAEAASEFAVQMTSPTSGKQLSELQTTESMEVSSGPFSSFRSHKRNRSPVVDLGACDSPAPVVWDPDNDLGNTMHRNKRYLSEAMANDLSRHMSLDSNTPLLAPGTRSSVSPPLPPIPPTSPRLFRNGLLRSYSNHLLSEIPVKVRSPTPEAASSESMDATAPEPGPSDGPPSRGGLIPNPSIETGSPLTILGWPRRGGGNEMACIRSNPIPYRPGLVREGGGAGGPVLSSVQSPSISGLAATTAQCTIDFHPGSPTDLRVSFDLRKTALLRSLLNRTEGGNSMITDDMAVPPRGVGGGAPRGALPKHMESAALLKCMQPRPRPTGAGMLVDLPSNSSLGLGESTFAAPATTRASLVPSQGFSRMAPTPHPYGMMDGASREDGDDTSSSSSSDDHRLSMPDCQQALSSECRSSAVSGGMHVRGTGFLCSRPMDTGAAGGPGLYPSGGGAPSIPQPLHNPSNAEGGAYSWGIESARAMVSTPLLGLETQDHAKLQLGMGTVGGLHHAPAATSRKAPGFTGVAGHESNHMQS